MASKAAPAERKDTGGTTVMKKATTVVSDVGAQVRKGGADSVAVVAQHAPAALAASRGSVAQALDTLRRSSTDSLVLSTVFAAGVTGGMLLSRAPRMLVALAFVPALVFGGTLLERWSMRLDEPSRAGHR